MELAVLDTREVLLDHLLAKVNHFCSSKALARKILVEVANNVPNSDIFRLLQNENALIYTINQSKAYIENKEELGEQLFIKVSALNSHLCAQITGMLLELNISTIKILLEDDNLLLEAVEKSTKKYLEYREEQERKEVLGERLYDLVCSIEDGRWFGERASRLTGMLLELDEKTLLRLLQDPEELKAKLILAEAALSRFYASQSSR